MGVSHSSPVFPVTPPLVPISACSHPLHPICAPISCPQSLCPPPCVPILPPPLPRGVPALRLALWGRPPSLLPLSPAWLCSERRQTRWVQGIGWHTRVRGVGTCVSACLCPPGTHVHTLCWRVHAWVKRGGLCARRVLGVCLACAWCLHIRVHLGGGVQARLGGGTRVAVCACGGEKRGVQPLRA